MLDLVSQYYYTLANVLRDKRKARLTPLYSVRWLGLFFGEVAERLKASDLKSATGRNPVAGSNPALSIPIQSPGGSCSFHRGNLTTRPKAMRSDKRNIRLRCVDFNRRVHNDLPQLQNRSCES